MTLKWKEREQEVKWKGENQTVHGGKKEREGKKRWNRASNV